jgi:hypothetical protein
VGALVGAQFDHADRRVVDENANVDRVAAKADANKGDKRVFDCPY